MTQIGFEAFQMLFFFKHILVLQLCQWPDCALGWLTHPISSDGWSPIRTGRQGVGDSSMLNPWRPPGPEILRDSVIFRKEGLAIGSRYQEAHVWRSQVSYSLLHVLHEFNCSVFYTLMIPWSSTFCGLGVNGAKDYRPKSLKTWTKINPSCSSAVSVRHLVIGIKSG